ncbi:hypothetical protein SH597_04745 [Lacticaseibacillus paracasei]|uniref:Prophage pi2 protein 40 n=1 Tax=Lacticaseibacillus paracasei TaxID=1597 RepID=A0ABD7BS24_LACPA|nr:hypothetical protein [Lacticaseibacillus paracasei]QOP54941.1 hypothetical protein HCJ88_03760 [Lacticaseibacillus paracasei]QPB56506.1 hypothetical protein GFB64_05065 [Lacticaseibacillus paracasei]WPQ31566.1 hypothetical protein SH597_04745 [Lacticaseibacillus paracasei]
MEKQITIDNKVITLKGSGAIPILYKSQFGTDFFGDVIQFSALAGPLEQAVDEDGNLDVTQLKPEQLDGLDLSVLYRLIWIFAKHADSSIAPMEEWFGQFDSFPLGDVMPAVTEILTALFKTSKK